MLHILVDTCVWLDMAKDYRHQPTLAALEQMIEAGEVALVLPNQSVDEFARNKERIIRDSGKRGLSQISVLNGMLTIGREIPAPNVVERIDDSECHCRKAEAPVEG